MLWSALAQAGLSSGRHARGSLESDGTGKAMHGSGRRIQLHQLVGQERQPTRDQLDGGRGLPGATSAADEDGRILIDDANRVERSVPLGGDRQHRDPGDQRVDRDVQLGAVGQDAIVLGHGDPGVVPDVEAMRR